MENFTVGMVKNDSRPLGCPAEVITELHAPSIVPSNHFGLESNTDMNTSSALKKEPLDRDEIKKFIADMDLSDNCEIGSPGEVSSDVRPTSIIPTTHFGRECYADVKDNDPNDNYEFGSPASPGEVNSDVHPTSIIPTSHFRLAGVKDTDPIDNCEFGSSVEVNSDVHPTSIIRSSHFGFKYTADIKDIDPNDNSEFGSPGEVNSVIHPTSIPSSCHFGLQYNADATEMGSKDNCELGSLVEVHINSDIHPTSIIPTNHFGLASIKDMDPIDNCEIDSPVHPTSIIPTSHFGLKYNADSTEMGSKDNCEIDSPVEVNSDVHPTSIIPSSHFGLKYNSDATDNDPNDNCEISSPGEVHINSDIHPTSIIPTNHFELEYNSEVKDIDPNDNSEFGSPVKVNSDVHPTSIIPSSHFGLEYNADATERGTNDKCELGALVDVRMELQESSISIPLSILTQSEIQQNLSVDNSIIKRQKARELKAIQMQSVAVTRPPNLSPSGKAQSEESVSCSQTEQGKSSMRVRQSYTAERKLEIVEYALTHGVKEAADKFHVNVGTVRMWRTKQDSLRKMPKDKKANRGPNAPGIEKFKKVHHLSFSAGDKLKVVQYATTHGICAAGREYCISMVKVRNWIKQKDELMKMPHKNIANCTEPVPVPSAMQQVFKRNTPCKEKGEGQRLAYTAGEKLQIVHYGLAYGQKAAAEKFNVSLSNIKAWRKMTNFLKKMPSDKMANRGNMPQCPSLEEALLNWINEKRQDGVLVSVDEIQERALSLSVGVSGMEDFTASHSWCQSFLRRNNQNQYFKSREKNIFIS